MGCTLFDSWLVKLVEFLFETCALAGAFTQEVQVRAADFGVAFNNDFLDTWGAGQEGALYADAVAGDATNGEVGIVAAIADADNGAFEFLNTFAIAFFDKGMNADDVSRAQLRDIFVCRCFE